MNHLVHHSDRNIRAEQTLRSAKQNVADNYLVRIVTGNRAVILAKARAEVIEVEARIVERLRKREIRR